jgi:hypothetical protein
MDQADMTPEGWAKVTEAVEAHFAGKGGQTGDGTGDEEPTPF